MMLMSGMGSWLEAGVDKRQLGMSVATVLLERSGDQVPGPGRLGSQTSSHWSTPHSTLKLDADMARVRSYVDKP